MIFLIIEPMSPNSMTVTDIPSATPAWGSSVTPR